MTARSASEPPGSSVPGSAPSTARPAPTGSTGSGGSGGSAASTRDRLIDVARNLFWRKGYNSTSVAEILDEADANSGSLYHFFPTKQELLVAVLEWYEENLWEQIVRPAYERTHDPIERVFAILAGYRQGLLMTELTFGCPIGSLALELHEPDPPVREMLALNFRNWALAVERCLDDAGDRLPDDVDREALSRFVLTTMEGGVMQARTHRSIAPFDASVELLRDYVRRLEADGSGSRSTHSSEEGSS